MNISFLTFFKGMASVVATCLLDYLTNQIHCPSPLGIGQIIAQGLDGTCQSVIEGSESRPGSKRDDSCGFAVVTLVTAVAGR